VDVYSIRYTTIQNDARFQNKIQSVNREFYVWTLNDDDRISSAIISGVDAILTDNVELCLQIRDEMSRNNNDNENSKI